MNINKSRFSLPLVILVFLAAFTIITPSCSRKSGCPAEDTHTKMDKKGNYKTGKPTSGLGLVPKKARKKN